MSIRVYILARELGVENNVVIDVCGKLNVKSNTQQKGKKGDRKNHHPLTDGERHKACEPPVHARKDRKDVIDEPVGKGPACDGHKVKNSRKGKQGNADLCGDSHAAVPSSFHASLLSVRQ